MATVPAAISQSQVRMAYRRIAVTGSTGFLGGRLVEYLQSSGAEVTCYCRPESQRDKLERLGLATRTFDLHSVTSWREALQDVDLVFHLAALVNSYEPAAYFFANTRIPAALGEAASSLVRPPTIVHCSSIAAAGPVSRGAVRRPGMPNSPVSLYGQSKRGGELALARHADRVPISVVRPGIIFGPGNRDLFPVFKGIALTRLHLVPGFRLPLLSLIYVDDVCEILWRAALHGARIPRAANGEGRLSQEQGMYFAAAPEHIDYAQLGRAVARALGLWHARLVIPQPLPWVIAAAAELLGRTQGECPPLTIDKMRESTAASWACADPRVGSDLGFRPERSIQERLNETAEWYRAAGWI